MSFLSSALVIVLTVCCSLSVKAQQTNQTCDVTNVCFLIDQSGSISSSEYDKEKSFVNEIAKQIKAINGAVQLSATGFASRNSLIQAPTSDLSTFTTAVNGPRAQRGGTAMSGALNACFTSLSSRAGNRIIVLVTDGSPNSRPATTAAAKKIRNEKAMYLVTVAVETGNSGAKYLKTVAHAPQFAIESDFAGLPQVVRDVVRGVCTVPDEVTPAPATPTPEASPSPQVTPAPVTPAPVEMDDCGTAYSKCIFKFRGESGLRKYDILPDHPDKAFTPIIVAKDPTKHVGIHNTNGIVPEFIGKTVQPITSFGSQRFTPTHFKPFKKAKEFGSGIGHQTFHGDQAVVAKGKCVRVYFTNYQVLESKKNGKLVVDNRQNVPRSANACVVFRT